jgi:hypothetical protein
VIAADLGPTATRIAFGIAVGLVIGGFVYVTARRQLMSFRYMVGWLTICLLGVAAGLFARLLGPIAAWLKVSPAAALAALAMIMLILISIQLSISISGLQRRNQDLVEEAAFLRYEVEKLQKRLDRDADGK